MPVRIVMRGLVCWTLVAILIISSDLCTTTNPGMKIRITKKGIDYANDIARGILIQNLRSLRIHDQEFESGKLSCKTSDIKVTNVNYPDSQAYLKPDSNGLQWAITDFGISITADYRAQYRGWWKITNSGWFRADVSGVDLWETVSFGRNGHTGRPTISHSHCSSHIRDVSIRFHGSWSWVINFFKNKIARQIKKSLQPLICHQVANVINGNARSSLAGMEVISRLADSSLVLCNNLVGAPKVTSHYLEAYGKGTFYYKFNRREPPFSPKPLPPWSSNNKEVYFWVTEYSFNTLLYQAHRFGLLKYQGALTKGDSTVDVSLKSASAPVASLTANKLTIDVSTMMEVKVRSPSYPVAKLPTTEVSINFTFEPKISQQNLVGQITSHR
ncbi:bactericidal permeability increasing protein [Elysia marginata]|uniref:Bactericidal permeability increasing protein n=1 Tax=Elysia marginata TaxID=1093978 RepID=A0AAV4GVC9_9GAST|nr:bactericidal permeability increasing protein [Elysia marginata]